MRRLTEMRLGFAFALMACAAAVLATELPCHGRTSSDAMAALRAAVEGSPGPSAVERVDRCLRLLREEIASPSTPCFGIGGGPIDSGYVQQVIIGSACTFAQKGREKEAIRSVLARKLATVPRSDRAMRERLTIMLGIAGQRSVIPQLIAILGKHPEGHMRFGAVMALREVGECREAIPALLRAMKRDNYARVRFGDVSQKYDPKTMVYSPVRSVAAEILGRSGVAVPKHADVLEAKYGVRICEPLLYARESSECNGAAIDVLEMIGGSEAETALRTYVRRSAGNAGIRALVDEAEAALARMRPGG